MKLLKKAAVSLAVLSVVAAPVVASAQSFKAARATSASADESELESGAIWALAIVAIVAGGALLISGNSDTPTSP